MSAGAPATGDYLARLLAPEQGVAKLPAIGGYLMTWNPATGENTVSIGAAAYTNLHAIRAAVTGPGAVLILYTPEPIIVGSIAPAIPTPPAP